MSGILTEEQIMNGASLPEVRRSHEALRVENIRLAAWVGGKWNLECISCGRCPIYGTMETVGIEGKALCSDCRGMRRIREQNTRIAELEAENERLKGDCASLERDASEDTKEIVDHAIKVADERDGLRRAIEAMAAPCIEWMVSKNGADWERRISFIADNYVEKMVFGIAMAAKSALAAAPAPAPVEVSPPIDRRTQAISFAYSNTKLHNPDITREMVAEAYDKLHAPSDFDPTRPVASKSIP